VPIARSTLHIARRLPKRLSRIRGARLTVTYAGSDRLLPGEVSAKLAG